MQSNVPFVRHRLFHLRRELRPRHRAAGGLLELSPWIDVVLLVLFFILTQTATLKKPGLQVNLPAARAASGARYDAHVLTIPQEGVYFFADERVPGALLAERLRQTAARNPGAELVIEADETIPYRSITAIYNQAVEAGWPQVVLATRINRMSGSTP